LNSPRAGSFCQATVEWIAEAGRTALEKKVERKVDMAPEKLLSYTSLGRNDGQSNQTRSGVLRSGVGAVKLACVLLCSLKIEYDAYRQNKPLSCAPCIGIPMHGTPNYDS
jgi:hypothetical protein